MEKKLNNQKKILFLTTSYPRFAEDIAGSFLVPLITELKEKFEIKIVAPDDILAISSDEVERFRYFYPRKWQVLAYGNGIPENLQKKPLLFIFFPFLFLGMLFKAYKLSKYCDVIISSWLLPSGLVGAIISRLTKKPHILIEHSAGAHFLKKLPLRKVSLSFVIKNSCKLVVVSPYLVDIFLQIAPVDKNKIEIIPMGINIDDYNISISKQEILNKYNICNGSINIIFIGRLVEIKGLDVLIKALNSIEDVNLIVLGDGSKEEEYKNLAKNNNVNAYFLGKITGKDKIELLNASDIVIIPSRQLKNTRAEGTPVLIIEAMACGKIIVASNTGGIPYIINDGVNGKLFESENEAELRNIILDIVKNKPLYYKFAEEAKISSQAFDVKRISGRYDQLIEEVLKND